MNFFIFLKNEINSILNYIFQIIRMLRTSRPAVGTPVRYVPGTHPLQRPALGCPTWTGASSCGSSTLPRRIPWRLRPPRLHGRLPIAGSQVSGNVSFALFSELILSQLIEAFFITDLIVAFIISLWRSLFLSWSKISYKLR